MAILWDKVRVYLVTDPHLSRDRREERIIEAAVRGGCGLVQFRHKGMHESSYLRRARELSGLCRRLGVPLILNDHVQVAADIDCAGVHLGQGDMPTDMARKLLGMGRILGRSTHDLAQATRACEEGADYINVGPVFATRTKSTVIRPVGLDLVRAVYRADLGLPFTTMGGIGPDNAREVARAGADRVAVVTALTMAEDVEAATRALVAAVQEGIALREADEAHEN